MTTPRKQKIGLVIGSGGIKALGIIPLFELLNEHNLMPDLLIGCSGGSVLSSQWAHGASIQELKNFVEQYKTLIEKNFSFRKIDFKTLLNFNNYLETEAETPSAILENSWMLEFLKQQFGNKKLEDCKIKTLLLATDLKTGSPVVMNEGLLSECIYASCALYPILPPIYLKKKWLVDGAYHSAIPILEASKNGCDKIISISFEEKPLKEHKNFFAFYMDFVSQVLNKNARKQNSFAIHFHHEEILFINCFYDKNINFWDVGNFDYIDKTTKETIEKNKDAILHYFKSLSASN